MKNKKIVVTGGAGFIGSNLVESLAEENEVKIIDDFSTGKKENISDLSVEIVEGSITNLDLLKEIFEGADYIFHQAALPSVDRSIKDPISSNEVNVDGTLKVLIAARDAGVKKVVYASSSSTYGDTPTLPKKEDMEPNPLSPYAITKLTGEYYCTIFDHIYGLPTVSLRYFNVYGPRQNPSSEYAAVIPRFINRVLNNEPPVIYGDGKQTRDFTFIKDVVRANILSAERGKARGMINVAGGKRITINELAEKIIDLTGKKEKEKVKEKLKPIYTEPRPGDIRHSLADISKAKKMLGYEPRWSLDDGLDLTVDWFR